MNNQDQNVIIKPKSDNKLWLMLGLVALPFFAYREYLKMGQKPDNIFYWFDLGLMAFLFLFCIVALIFNEAFTKKATLTLTPEGFLKGKTLYRWREIEQFGITTRYATCWSVLSNRKAIFWNYKSLLSNISASQKFSKLMVGYHDSIDSDYEIDTDKLARMLNDWLSRYTGVYPDVLDGTALDKKISNRVFFFVVGLLVMVILTFILFAIPTR